MTDPKEKSQLVVTEWYESGQSGTRTRAIQESEEVSEPKRAIPPPPMEGGRYEKFDTIPTPQIPSREWVAGHLHELAERVRVDLEVVAFDARWDNFNQRYEVKLSLKKEEE